MPTNYCTVSDAYTDPLGNGISGRTIQVKPVVEPYFLDGSSWNETANQAANVVTSLNGAWSVNLPYPSISFPSGSPWQITMPDGTIFTGTVPSVAGPLTLHDLVVTYGWQATTS